MYMPLCRACHMRESQLSEQQFLGDPEDVDANREMEAKAETDSRSLITAESDQSKGSV